MRDYFEAEMRQLFDAAQTFAQAYPEQARMLDLREVKDRDPYVERLLEGMAFLSAQIHRRIDDDIPEITETLLRQMWPQLLEPFPSAIIAAFVPRQGQMQHPHRIAAGSVLSSRAIGAEHTVCRFQTTADVTVLPLRISQAGVRPSGEIGSELTLSFQLDAGVHADTLGIERLKIFLHADPSVAVALHHALTAETRSVRLAFPHQAGASPRSLGDQTVIAPCHLSRDDILMPASGRSFYGYHLLHDYFCFREKYFFFEITGLDTVDWPPHCHSFDVAVHVTTVLDEALNIRKDNFQLHCTPAVNRFATTSEPILLSHRRTAYPVVADINRPDSVWVHTVDQVMGMTTDTGEQHRYHPLSALHRDTGEDRFFAVSQRGDNRRPMAWLSVSAGENIHVETLSCTITANNGHYPRRFLKEHDIQGAPADTPAFIRATNLTRPTKLLPPPDRPDLRLALVSQLSLNYDSIGSADALRRLLRLYDWSGSEQNRRRIDGIEHVALTSIDQYHRGALYRGLSVQVTVDERQFLSRADVHLFGQVLHELFCMYATINSFVRTQLLCLPSQQEFAWMPRFGDNRLL